MTLERTVNLAWLRLLPLLALAAGCGGRSPAALPPPAQGGFSLTVSPASLTIAPGAAATATVSVARIGASVGAIEISLDGVPEGVGVDPLIIPAGASSGTLTFHNGRVGNSLTGVAVSVRGTSGAQTAAVPLALTVQCPANGQQLSLLAGALGGPGFADDTGETARFNLPIGVVGDGAGRLYVTDTLNQVIRKIDLVSGAVTTFAGSAGKPGASDGTGAAARFSFPFALTRAGDSLFVTDTFNHLIRRIDLASGAVTTFAGVAGKPGSADGPAATARFDTPTGIAAAAGSLFVADTANHTIRKIDIATAVVTTLAGSPGEPGSADGICDLSRFNGPEGVAADGSGNLFVADSFNHTIRKIVIATEAVSTIAGAAGQPGTAGGVGTAARFNFPTGIESDGAGTLFVADTQNHFIRSISLASGEVVVIWGATSPACVQSENPGRLCFPRGVAVDRGTLYVANASADDIRAMDLDETIVGGDQNPFRIVAGGALHRGSDGARFDDPIFIASDGADSIYVADSNNNQIRKVSLSFAPVTTVAGSAASEHLCCDDGIGPEASFGHPSGVALDGEILYVTDTFGDIIREIAIATREVTTIAGKKFTPGLTDGIGADARFSGPTGIVADGRGHLYIADSGSAIRAIDLATRSVSTVAGTSQPGSADGTGAGASFASPGGLALDASGNLYVADTGNHTIRKIVLASGAVTTLAGAPGIAGSMDGNGAGARFNAPFGLAPDEAGGLFVSESTAIRRIALATGAVSTVLGQPGIAGVKLGAPPARLNRPAGLAVIGPGQLAIVDRAENVLLTLR